MSSLAELEVHRVFGLKADARDNLCFVDESTVVYPAGSTLVTYNPQTQEQRFIPGSDGAVGYTAMAVSPNRRYVALAEGGEAPCVGIYDLHTQKRRKVLTDPESEGAQIVSLAFSPDSKYLVTLGGSLLYWTWEKSRGPMARIAVSGSQASFSPTDNTQLCVTGEGVFRLFRYQEGMLKQLAAPKLDGQACLCHAWLTETRVVVGTDRAKVLVFDSGELRGELDAFTGHAADELRVEHVAQLGAGFVAGGTFGLLEVFEAVEDTFRSTKLQQVPQDTGGAQAISTIAVAPSGQMLALATNAAQLYSLSLMAVEEDAAEPMVEPMAERFHHAAINAVATCVRKPLVATCSKDNSVRIWNYAKNTAELVKYFTEEPLSVAMHPSGFYCLVGFTDKLRLLNVLMDDIRPFKEFPIRNCREVVFSHGGQRFAAANGQHIDMYATYSFEFLGHLKGHAQRVQAIRWSADDSKLISCGLDGAVYEWDPQTMQRTGDSVLKSCAYTSVACTPDAGTTFAVGSDRTMKQIEGSVVAREIPTNNKSAPIETVLAEVVLSHSGRLLLTATETGTVRTVRLPLTTPWEGASLPVHAARVRGMAFSHDDQYLFSVAEDGCLVAYKVNEPRAAKPKEPQWADEVLITRRDLEEKDALLAEKQTQVEELKMSNEYQLRLKEMSWKDQLRELEARKDEEIDQLRMKLQTEQTEREKEEHKHDTEIRQVMADHQRVLQKLEHEHSQKLLGEYGKYQGLQQKSQQVQEKCERQLEEMEQAKGRALEDLAEFWENKLLEKSSLLDAANETHREAQREHREVRRQIEVDADREILAIKNEYERRLKEERESGLRLKGDNGILRKKFKSLHADIEEQKVKRLEMEAEQAKLHSHIKALEKDILSGKKEIEERDETIQDKEKRIYDLKRKNQELEKFKFVLDYKIKELKKQIEPREAEIKENKAQIAQMDEELSRYHSMNGNLDLTIEHSKMKLATATTELRTARGRVRSLENRLARLRSDLHATVQLATNPAELASSVKQLYKTYCAEGKEYETTVEADIQHEHAKQRDFLERSVAGLRKGLKVSAKLREDDTTRVMHENVVLIREVNQLRQELKLSTKSVHQLESSLHTARVLAEMRGQAVPEEDAGALTMSLRERSQADNLERIVALQKAEIQKLRTSHAELERTSRDRPPSTGFRLDPLGVEVT